MVNISRWGCATVYIYYLLAVTQPIGLASNLAHFICLIYLTKQLINYWMHWKCAEYRLPCCLIRPFFQTRQKVLLFFGRGRWRGNMASVHNICRFIAQKKKQKTISEKKMKLLLGISANENLELPRSWEKIPCFFIIAISLWCIQAAWTHSQYCWSLLTSSYHMLAIALSSLLP